VRLPGVYCVNRILNTLSNFLCPCWVKQRSSNKPYDGLVLLAADDEQAAIQSAEPHDMPPPPQALDPEAEASESLPAPKQKKPPICSALYIIEHAYAEKYGANPLLGSSWTEHPPSEYLMAP
jgi:hypothetical protein